MLTYPHINPVLWTFGPFEVHWYGLMYMIGFIAAGILGVWRAHAPWQPAIKNYELVFDGLIWGMLGVILGGRIGYVFFYNLFFYLQHPQQIFYIWDGGMSFHGGLLGVLCAAYLFSKKNKIKFFDTMDFYAPFVPIGLAAGRIGNFINGELFGRICSPNFPLAMVFPNGGPFPRYPSEIFECLGEGILLFFILWFYSQKSRPRGHVSALFLISYGIIRFILEFFRQPDPQLGFVLFNFFTMGQILCIPMILLGILLMFKKLK